MTLDLRWDGPRPTDFIVRGSADGPVYCARIAGTDRQHGFVREFLGTSTYHRLAHEEVVVVPTSELRAGEVLEVQEGVTMEEASPYQRFVIWHGARFSRVEIGYALHALRVSGVLATGPR